MDCCKEGRRKGISQSHTMNGKGKVTDVSARARLYLMIHSRDAAAEGSAIGCKIFPENLFRHGDINRGSRLSLKRIVRQRQS